MTQKTRDFLRFDELDRDELLSVLDSADSIKASGESDVLCGRTLGMIFQKPSTRTRISFEVGMQQLGGRVISLSPDEMQLSRGETMADTARTLSRYLDVVMARVYGHDLLEELALHSSIPVINGLSNSFHPCQTLADIMTIREKKGSLDKIRIAWVGDGNNVCNSLLLGCGTLGIRVSVATPKGYEPDAGVVESVQGSTRLELVQDPTEAVADADVVMTDTFSSIHDEKGGRDEIFMPRYQVNRDLMRNARDDAIFMHCLPAKRGREVSAEVIDGPQSVVWDEAENRLHAQKALLASIFEKEL